MKTRSLILFILLLLIFGATFALILFLRPAPPRSDIANQTEALPTDNPQIPIPTTSFLLPDTGQTNCFDNTKEIPCPKASLPFYGQDANYSSNPPSYTNNNNGTVTDNNTGLVWTSDPGVKLTYQEAKDKLSSFSLAGHSDWRLPSIKELYTLINFSGTDPSSLQGNDTSSLIPFMNTSYFNFNYGDPKDGDRIIDSQWITSTIYNSTVMNNQECFFGVNFADGRIKCYPINSNKKYFSLFVRGKALSSSLKPEGLDVILDTSTNLLWQKSDSGRPMNWLSALEYCQTLDLEDRNDWRLPNAKELQSIVDYSRSPDITNSPAINPLFETSTIINELGQTDYPYYWTSTTHLNTRTADQAVYISFGKGFGYMNGRWMDVHGAGSQRSDPKSGDPSQFPQGRGPQGDAIRINNYVRCVTDNQ